MENLRSSQSASTSSCSLRAKVRSWVRNRFLASCWVMVEPPCDTPRRHQVGDGGPHEADRVDAEVAVEAVVLDREERLRQIGRHLLQRQRRAVHLAARREQLCRRCRRSRSTAAAAEFQANGSAAGWRQPRRPRRRRRSAPTGRAPRTSRTAAAAADGARARLRGALMSSPPCASESARDARGSGVSTTGSRRSPDLRLRRGISPSRPSPEARHLARTVGRARLRAVTALRCSAERTFA